MSQAIRAGRAFVELYADRTQLERDLRAAERVVQQVGSGFARVGAVVTSVGAAITGGFVVALEAASSKAETMNAFGQVFAGANAEAERLATTLSNRVGRSMGSIAAGMTPIGSMVKGLGLAADEAARFAADATAAALDLSSFRNISPEEALARVQSALSGSSEAVDQFGINLRAQALSLELAELGYAGNVQAAGELEKTLARLSLIQKANERNNAAGDLERTKDDYANLTRTLGDSLRELAAAAGNAVKPIAEQLLRGFVAVTQAAMQWVQANPAAVQAIAGFGAAAAVAGTVLLGVGTALMATAGVYAGIRKSLGLLAPVMSSVSAVAAMLGGALTGALAGSLVIAGLAALHKQTGALKPLFEALATAGARIAAVWQSNVVPAFAKLGQILGGSFGRVLGSVSPLLKSLAEGLGVAIVFAAEAAAGALAVVADTLGVIFDAIAKLLGLQPRQPSQVKLGAAGGDRAAAAPAAQINGDLQQFADSVKQSLQTPEQAFAEQMAKLDQALQAGALTADEHQRGSAQARQARDEALKAEFEQSDAGRLDQDLQRIAEQVRQDIETPQEAYAAYMEALDRAFAAGKVTVDEYRRAAEQQQARIDELAAQEEAARLRAADEQRSEQRGALSDRLDNDISLARASGNLLAELKALTQAGAEARRQGFGELADDYRQQFAEQIFAAAGDLERRVAENRDQADMTTVSAREAAFGLGQRTLDEQLLKEQQIVSAAAKKTAERLGILVDLFQD